MITPAGLIMSSARRMIQAENGRRLSRSALIASGLAVLVFIAVLIFLRDRSMVEVAVVELPPRPPAELLNEPVPPAPELNNAVPEVAVHEDVAAIPEALPEPMTPVVPRREPAPKVAPDAGQAGRARAQAATAELAKATSNLDKALGDLDGALRTTTAGYEPAVRRRALVRGGRGAGDLGAVNAGSASSGAGADLGSAVKGQSVAIGSLTASDAPASDDASGPSGAAAPGVYRTNASLLAVIQRYAAGIQYCYGNELKRDPSLRGKLVVAITVDAAGRVTAADVIQDTVGSPALATCALSQIRDWRFPAIPRGVTTFQAPFVFTPPN
jgi:TonB family protein